MIADIYSDGIFHKDVSPWCDPVRDVKIKLALFNNAYILITTNLSTHFLNLYYLIARQRRFTNACFHQTRQQYDYLAVDSIRITQGDNEFV